MNEWWAGNGTERFWMEITTREDLGADLWAPQVDDAGREYWSYALVRYVREDDLILHWSKPGGEPAIVGWSRVAGQPVETTIEWQSRGASGRDKPSGGEEPAWLAPLTSFSFLEQPITQARMRELEAVVRRVRDKLAADYDSPLYFPFAISDRRPLRAAQGYLVKFPRDLLAAIPELQPLLALAEAPTNSSLAGKEIRPTSNRGVGRLADAAVREAIERHAVDTVMTEFIRRGYSVTDVGSIRSWDVEARRGDERVHIEVKGSATRREAIELTDNEVRHAEDYPNSALVVVDDISWSRTEDGCIVASGGTWREWSPWTPSRSDLLATRYRYVLPKT